MGLEIVELFERLEREFDVKIDDKDAVKVAYLKELYNLFYVYSIKKTAIIEQEVIDRINKILIEEYSIPMEQITLESHIVYDLKLD